MKKENNDKADVILSMQAGDKVIFIPEGKTYDFGYIGATGKIIIYEEGERNMQDSFAVDAEKLKPAY